VCRPQLQPICDNSYSKFPKILKCFSKFLMTVPPEITEIRVDSFHIFICNGSQCIPNFINIRVGVFVTRFDTAWHIFVPRCHKMCMTDAWTHSFSSQPTHTVQLLFTTNTHCFIFVAFSIHKKYINILMRILPPFTKSHYKVEKCGCGVMHACNVANCYCWVYSSQQ
jgi:hypothetical protein